VLHWHPGKKRSYLAKGTVRLATFLKKLTKKTKGLQSVTLVETRSAGSVSLVQTALWF
jgi:hypothetical protein